MFIYHRLIKVKLFISLFFSIRAICYISMSDKKSKDKLQKWRCSLCEFDNIQLLDTCEMCQTKRSNKPKLQERQDNTQHIDIGIICINSKCKTLNQISAQQCKKCKTAFEDFDVYDLGDEPEKKLKYCFNCAFQNDSLNQNCVSCQISLKKKVQGDQKVRIGKAGVMINHPNGIYCEDCGKKKEKIVTIRVHLGDIYSDYHCRACLKRNTLESEYHCLFCDSKVQRQLQTLHKQTCGKRLQFFNAQRNDTFKRCSKLQIDTVFHMHNKCQALHQQMKSLLIQKIKLIGYNEKDLDNLHHYVINYAPIIIHIRVNTNMKFFTKDTHYRNCFQIRGACPSRVKWEDRMFDRIHHKASYNERVKYGTMNFTNDPNGVMACSGYGMSYFLLKSHVRDRCTITDMDSASSMATIATFRFLYHLFIKLSNQQLKSAIEASKGKQMLSNVIRNYKQIQIHGPVQFAKDIERVYICKQQLLPDESGNLALVKQFCAKNKIQYQIFTHKIPVLASFINHKISEVVVKQAPQRILDKEIQETLNASIQKTKKKH